MIYVLIVISAWQNSIVSFQEFNSWTACIDAAKEIQQQAQSLPSHKPNTLRMSCVKKGATP